MFVTVAKRWSSSPSSSSSLKVREDEDEEDEHEQQSQQHRGCPMLRFTGSPPSADISGLVEVTISPSQAPANPNH